MHRETEQLDKNIQRFCYRISWWLLGIDDQRNHQSDVIQEIEKTKNNSHTIKQKRTNNSFLSLLHSRF